MRGICGTCEQACEVFQLAGRTDQFCSDCYVNVEAMRATKEKRGKGRAAILNKLAILDAAAFAKVRDGRYTQVAHRWKLTPQQLMDLVRHNRTYFASMVKALRKNATVKAWSWAIIPD